jgi:hypothetical protein
MLSCAQYAQFIDGSSSPYFSLGAVIPLVLKRIAEGSEARDLLFSIAGCASLTLFIALLKELPRL